MTGKTPESSSASTREFHRMPAHDVLSALGTTERGLTSAEARERLAKHGPNVLPEPPRTHAFFKFAAHVTNRFAMLLLAGALLAAIGEYFQPDEGMALIAIALFFTVLLNAAFSFWQEMGVERAMAGFRQLLSPRGRVLRDGAEVDIEAASLVPGDVVVLREGDRVPADVRLFESNGLKVDNSPLTGECEPQLRCTEAVACAALESRNLAFTSTLVTTGDGLGVVIATGADTVIARIAGVTQSTRRIESPLRRELKHFIQVLTIIALALGALFFVTGFAIGNSFWINLVFAIGIIVANVPEGLLPTVTMALAVAGRRMAKRKALLKTLESAETLGCTTVICTDKTGTLTQNEMRVTELLAHDGRPLAGKALDAAYRVMVLCNNARLDVHEGGVRALGDPTEAALLLHVQRFATDLTKELPRAYPRIHERPFDGATREMATTHRSPEGIVVYLKGAPEVVAGHCTRFANGSVLPEPMTESKVRDIGERANALARSGRRVLALARKTIGTGEDPEYASLRPDYEFIGLAAMQDPPRPEVRASVDTCHQAGIRVIVVSGDHPLTVECVARDTGVIAEGEVARVYTGADLALWDDARLREAVRERGVLFARTSPLDKLRIVIALQENGEVVAVTGDGVNDAPALKRADIGVAMGKSGTDVAREAADMILMDDNFSTIVAAVEEGRVIFGNIRRFIGYVLTSNVPEILPYIAFVLLGIPLPMPVLLILAIDLGTDLMPAIGLATETPEEDVMRQPPRRRNERMLTKKLLLTAYCVRGVWQSVAGFTAYFCVLYQGGWTWGQELAPHDPLYGQSIGAFFAAVVITQIANVMNWRTTRQSVFAKGLFANRMVMFGILTEIILVLFIVQSSPGNYIFGTSPMPLWAWLVPVPFALAMLASAELGKWRARARG